MMRLLAVVLLACVSCALGAGPPAKIFPFPFTQEELPNGLRLVTMRGRSPMRRQARTRERGRAMADSAGLLVLVATCVVMLVVPLVQAARANGRDLARLKEHVALRRAHQAGTLGMPIQQAADQLADHSVPEILGGEAT